MKVAAFLIVKASDDSEVINLSKALGSINGYVDTIYIQLNAPKGVAINKKVRQVAEQFTEEIFVYEWKDNFVDARNAIMSKIPKKYDWIVWIDSDDIVENAEMIKPSLAVMPDNVHGVFIMYDYQKDKFGNVLVSHWNIRAVKNKGAYLWKSSFEDNETAVHETLVAQRSVRAVGNDEWKVIHQATTEDLRGSLLRNITLLRSMADRQAKTPQGIDPRILFYLGSHNFDAYNYREAEEMFITYLERSGWAEERAEAHIYMGKILLMHKKDKMAKHAFLMSMGEYADNPGSYLGLGKIEASNKRWQQAAAWFRRGTEVKRDMTSMVKYNYDWELYSSYAEALANLGGKNLPEALKIANKAFKLRPYDPISKQNRDNVLQLIDYRDDLRAVTRLLRKLKDANREAEILDFLKYLPENIEDSPVVISAKQDYTPPKVWPKKSIALYVGQGPLGIWGPWSLDEGGTGGSEEAVVRLSRELAKLGWKVTVFAMPGKKAGKWDGIEWKHYWELNNKDKFDVLISWRQPAFFDFKFNARKKYLWMHDVTKQEELTPERLKNLDKIIYVSKYHAERPENSHVPDTKKLASGNGITPEDFNKYDGRFKRDPYRLIYMSANERGLRLLYDIWEELVKAVPDVYLTPYYGWESFDAVNRDNPERMAWKATMTIRAKELGIPASIRLGHDEINQEIFKSGIFAYPCVFPEVNCISIQKAMAGGAIPVTSDFAVLKDYKKWGVQVHIDEDTEAFKKKYLKKLIDVLKHPELQESREIMMQEVRQKYSWENTARQWDAEMKP